MPVLFGIIHEPDVAITDWILALEVLLFAVLIARNNGSRVIVGTLIALMLASLFGGAYHAFFPLKTTTDAGWIVWIVTMLSIGTASAGLLAIAIASIYPKLDSFIRRAGVLLLAAYAVYVVLIDHEFVTAILFYLPALLAFLVAMVVRYARTKTPGALAGIASVVLMLKAALLQQMQIGLHPLYFNHNALYHVIQFIALWLLFIALKTLSNGKRRAIW